MLLHAFEVITAWGFTYKTCGFYWTKVDAIGNPFSGTGYWTRANTEPCLLATRGKPKRINADVAQAIIEPRREHSRKPDCVHDRIVGGPNPFGKVRVKHRVRRHDHRSHAVG